MCHHFLHYSHRAVSTSDFNLLRTTIARIAIIAIIVALKDHLALLACQSGSGREVYSMIINIIFFIATVKEIYLQFVQLSPFP